MGERPETRKEAESQGFWGAASSAGTLLHCFIATVHSVQLIPLCCLESAFSVAQLLPCIVLVLVSSIHCSCLTSFYHEFSATRPTLTL